MDEKLKTVSETSSIIEAAEILEKDITPEADLEKGDLQEEKDNSHEQTHRSRKLDFDRGEEHVKFRRHWWQLWIPKDPPPPAPESLSDASIIPIVYASIFSILTYNWINPIMMLGYQRTLQATDLWKMDETREAGVLSAKLDAAWDIRVKKADEWNARLVSGEIKPGLWLRVKWFFKALCTGSRYRKRRTELEKQWREHDGKQEASIAWALNDVFGWTFWTGGAFKVIGDTAQLMGPVIVRTIIEYSDSRMAARAAGTPVEGLGRGVGMAIGLFCTTVTTSVCQHQFFWRSMTTGMLARAALIGSIYKRGVALTGKARTEFPNAKLVTHISTDVSRVDACAQWFHATWTAPIQVTVCLVILLVELGPSALAGFSLFLLLIPIQERVMSFQFGIGKKTLVWTDKRSKLILEVLGAMRVVKYFSYELPFLKRIGDMRKMELKGIRKIQFARSANIASAFSVPVLAATLSFVTYTSTKNSFNVAIIFSSLSLFNLLRQPLMFLPRALSATTDAQNALERLKVLFHAELSTGDAFITDPQQEPALLVQDATFEWEESTTGKEAAQNAKATGKMTASAREHEHAAPFQVKDVNVNVPRGTLVAVVGSVGSGKSSLLQGLIGEMRKVKGHVSFGGKVAYCSQTAWIQNASLKENILFGRPFNQDRYWKAIADASLLPDLEVLPDGDLTEIGEKGINLSGGQKQRVNIARALYYNADVVIFDDPLSAVDAHVGKALFADAILGALRGRGKTIILVTHALHFLSQCDYIYTMKNGRIEEQGTFNELVDNGCEFSRLIKEFGGTTSQEEEAIEEQAADTPKGQSVTAINETRIKLESAKRAVAGTGKLEGRLIVPEKRMTGSVSWRMYGEYLKAGKGFITFPLLLLLIAFMQGCTIMNSYTLIWWEANRWDKPNSVYQIMYACLGIGQALFTFAVGATMDVMGFLVSHNLHHHAIRNIFYAPMTYFDTTPTGRILSIFGKDIENIDNQLPVSMRLFVLTIANVVGSVTIITVLEHYFIIAVVAIAFGYNYFAAFYRSSARELKRIDAMLRSILYAHFAESLSGLPTIRSYGEINRFLKDNEYYVDLEDRAGIITVTNQRWLAIRLDFLGGLLIFIVAMLAISDVSGINPAQIGLVLTYSTALVQLCGMVTRQSAEVETYMSSVERVIEYSRDGRIEQEAPHEIKSHKPATEWPAQGAIEFKDVVMRYRSGLPFVLKGLSMNVKGGEKIGVVGRTGAGKSTLMLALFRIVELHLGSITIDGIDIAKIGLKDLRSKISIIPQDPLLFSGTIRSNLDPFSQYTDAHLWDALRRSFLVDSSSTKPESDSDEPHSPTGRFNLETPVESEGANLSVGERSLLSLARALVKDSQVVVLDEATASVDLETDSKIQQTIQTQFSHKTLLCIAHRLRTIISYDRILVLDAGQIAEFDTPLNLFDVPDGIFRGMCERSGITAAEIEKAALRARGGTGVAGLVENSIMQAASL
ncbi:uncharacterized protein FIBRA_03466 [Fibroporia radiculosa]|uniref:ABC protein n=1 Tax=Fibroporia radiculosa TaxID=599839 RepID=J4GNH8_9APHY|nr:uncharacterized protein FIBRA_03466 [Fibroporia radiculosa]CCM01415.1 predicted protein [Fibroporia radiculosa]